MLLLYFLCNHDPCLCRDFCICHPRVFEWEDPGFDPVSVFLPFFSSLCSCMQWIKRQQISLYRWANAMGHGGNACLGCVLSADIRAKGFYLGAVSDL